MNPAEPNRSSALALVSVQVAAALLSVSTRQIYHLIGQGRLESFKLGRLRRISRASLEAYIASCADPPVRPGSMVAPRDI